MTKLIPMAVLIAVIAFIYLRNNGKLEDVELSPAVQEAVDTVETTLADGASKAQKTIEQAIIQPVAHKSPVSLTPAMPVEIAEPAKPKQTDVVIDGHPVSAVYSYVSARAKDGDSVMAVDAAGTEHELRLASIDAPEWKQRYGQQAKDHLAKLLQGNQATAYQVDTDRYGRRVVFLFTTSTLPNEPATEVNAQMVVDGYAWHAIKHSSNPKLTTLEANARRNRLGLWDDANPTPPWEYRDNKIQARSVSE